MLSNCLIDIEKEIGRHIGLAKSLTERNEVLSSKVVYLESQLKERDRELQKERRTVEDHLQVKTKQSAEIERLRNRCEKLEKDMTLMKQTAQVTKNSSVVSDFSSAMTTNLKKISQLEIENEQLKSTVETLKGNQRNTDRIIEQNNSLIQKLAKEQDQLKIELNMAREREQGTRLFSEQLSTQNNQLLQLNNNLQNQHKDQLNAHQEELKQLIESLRGRNEEIEEFRKQNEERNTVQLQNLKDSIEQKYYSIDRKVDSMQIRLNRLPGKFVCVSHWDSREYLASDNVEHISFKKNNLDNLVHTIPSYRKELLIKTCWTNVYTPTSGFVYHHPKLLSLCQEWKRLRPDGEIHCLCWYQKGESPLEPSEDLATLLTTCNKYRYIDVASHISAIRKCWPKFAVSILSDKIKNEYPA